MGELVGSLRLQAYSAQDLSTYHMLLDEVDEAVAWGRRAIKLVRRLGWGTEYTGQTLFTLACCATKRGDVELGATLLGAFEAA